MERIWQSSHILSPLLSSLSPPLSAVITDMTLAFSVSPVVQALHLPNYILFTSSAKMLSLFLSFNSMVGPEATIDVDGGMIKIPGLEPLPRSWIPPPLLGNTDNLLKTSFINNGKRMAESSGILVNTFDSIEQEVLNKLNSGEVIENWPPVMAIGPFAPFEIEKNQTLAWLDEQQNGSVLYVSFGSRTVISGEQLKELGEGLVSSGTKFLWMVKGKKIDKDDDEGCLSEVIGNELEEKLKDKGLVVKSWLNQECILSHPAIGGFISHCGWNSVTEAIRHGVPILAWPQHGDQKINADIVERIGLGAWDEGYGWGGERVVNGEEIAEKIKEVMGNEVLRAQATHIREEARRAQGNDGSSSKELLRLIEKWSEI